jgi:hypothetical protein
MAIRQGPAVHWKGNQTRRVSRCKRPSSEAILGELLAGGRDGHHIAIDAENPAAALDSREGGHRAPVNLHLHRAPNLTLGRTHTLHVGILRPKGFDSTFSGRAERGRGR